MQVDTGDKTHGTTIKHALKVKPWIFFGARAKLFGSEFFFGARAMLFGSEFLFWIQSQAFWLWIIILEPDTELDILGAFGSFSRIP